MYSKRDNISELYELEAQLRDIKQGDHSVSKFLVTYHNYGNRLTLLSHINGHAPPKISCLEQSKISNECLVSSMVYTRILMLLGAVF